MAGQVAGTSYREAGTRSGGTAGTARRPDAAGVEDTAGAQAESLPSRCSVT
ncbi:hypothetical protein ACWC5I_43950 [Kitasatospora sp. NPDC001574]